MADDSSARVGYFCHAVSKKDLKPGDHIYVRRTLGLYDHHGIYIGKGGCEVIQFSGTKKSDARIESCTVEEFCKGSQLRLVPYNQALLLHAVKMSGTSHYTQSDPVEDVIKRAEYYLNNGTITNCCSITVRVSLSTARLSRKLVDRSLVITPWLS